MRYLSREPRGFKMAKSKMIGVRIEPMPKQETEVVLGGTPNAATQRALREVGSRKKIEAFESVAAWAKATRSAESREPNK
jgi:hypothetical protein